MQHVEDAIRAVLERAVGGAVQGGGTGHGGGTLLSGVGGGAERADPAAAERADPAAADRAENPARASSPADAGQIMPEAFVPAGVAPGAAAVAGTADARTAVVVAGVRKGGGLAVTADTRFDLASLTKVMATLPSILALAHEGELELDEPVRRFFSNAGWFQQPSLADATVRELLVHRSGLPAWKPLFGLVSERRTAIANALQTELASAPGTEISYSDLGFIVLGAIVERVAGMRLDAFAHERVYAPLGASSLQFRPADEAGGLTYGVAGAAARVADAPFAATEDCGWRGMVLEGIVHDENAWAMDGVAGHAGLFGAADDVATYAQAWLRAVSAGPVAASAESGSAGAVRRSSDAVGGPAHAASGPAPAGLPFSTALARESVREQARTPEIRRGLAWQLSSSASPAGDRAGLRAFGHTGFTGTSLWIDPDAGWFTVLLTNRVHPTRFHGEAIGRLRRVFHDRVAQAIAESA